MHENSLKNLIRPKKGETPNPNGRPKGAKSFKTLINEYLNKEIDIKDEKGKVIKRLIQKQKLIEKMLKLATSEDVKPETNLKALDMIMDRTDGKPMQKTENLNIEQSLDEWIGDIKQKEESK